MQEPIGPHPTGAGLSLQAPGGQPAWRALTTCDLPALVQIAGEVHPGFFEAPEIFAERLRLYPQGAWLLAGSRSGLGYVLSHPWQSGTVPALNTLLEALPARPDTYYIHDLALLPEARGTGAGSAIIETLAHHASSSGFATMSLIAVNDSLGFWARNGFVPQAAPDLSSTLASYENSAHLMVRWLLR